MAFNSKSRIFFNDIPLQVELGINISDVSGSKITPLTNKNKQIINYQYISGYKPIDIDIKVIFTDEVNQDLYDTFISYAKNGNEFLLVTDEFAIDNGYYIFNELISEISMPKFVVVAAKITMVASSNHEVSPVNNTNNIYSTAISNLINISDMYFIRNITLSDLIYLKMFLSLIGCLSGDINNVYDENLDISIKNFLVLIDMCNVTTDKLTNYNNLNKQNLNCILNYSYKFFN